METDTCMFYVGRVTEICMPDLDWKSVDHLFYPKLGLEWFKMAYYIVITLSFCHNQNLKLNRKTTP